MTVQVDRLQPADMIAIQRQPSQRMQLGIERELTLAEAEEIAAAPGEAWTARHDGRIIACLGLRETFPGRQAVAWAILSEGLGGAHLAITRFARARIRDSRLARIEAITNAHVPAEGSWATLVGLAPVHLLRCFGGQSEPHVLHERIREA